MSECVVRMEMPTENTVCELNYYSSLYREWRCTITDKRCNHNKNGYFPSWCPIICQIPEGHGRLVDAGNAFNKIVESSIDGYISNVGVYSCLQELNTIVPAERSETK